MLSTTPKIGGSSAKLQGSREVCTAGIRDNLRELVIELFSDLSRQACEAGFTSLAELVHLRGIFHDVDEELLGF
jgi:hypothetical protein